MSAAGQCRILPCFSCIRASLWSVVMIFVFRPVFLISRLNWMEASRRGLPSLVCCLQWIRERGVSGHFVGRVQLALANPGAVLACVCV